MGVHPVAAKRARPVPGPYQQQSEMSRQKQGAYILYSMISLTNGQQSATWWQVLPHGIPELIHRCAEDYGALDFKVSIIVFKVIRPSYVIFTGNGHTGSYRARPRSLHNA